MRFVGLLCGFLSPMLPFWRVTKKAKLRETIAAENRNGAPGKLKLLSGRVDA